MHNLFYTKISIFYTRTSICYTECMIIKSLTISSYKSFIEPAAIKLSSNFNIFIGANNCGKTNILDAIDFLMNPQKDPSRLHHHRSDIQMSLTLDRDEQSTCACAADVTVTGKQYKVTMSDRSGPKTSLKLQQTLAAKVRRLRYADFNDLPAIERSYSDLAQKHPKAFARMTALLNKYFPEIESVERIADTMTRAPTTVSEGRHKSITIERLGGGFRRVLVIVLYTLHPEYSVVLIDEPEIHLHPAMIKRIKKLLQATQANQVIVTSHSPLFVNASSLHQVYRVLKDDQGSHVYYMSQAGRGVNRRRLVQELNSDNVEMFFADKVLLVEGVSDRILMRGLIDRFYKGHEDIKVIYTHGKSNIDVYMNLMKIFRIPYLVMLDRDALYEVAKQFGLYHRGRRRRGRRDIRQLQARLHERHMFVLDNGTIEHNYPRKYQTKDSKPLNALYAAANITQAEYNSSSMRNLKNIIDQL